MQCKISLVKYRFWTTAKVFAITLNMRVRPHVTHFGSVEVSGGKAENRETQSRLQVFRGDRPHCLNRCQPSLPQYSPTKNVTGILFKNAKWDIFLKHLKIAEILLWIFYVGNILQRNWCSNELPLYFFVANENVSKI